MRRPLILAVAPDQIALNRVCHELDRRYGCDYHVLARTTGAEAIAELDDCRRGRLGGRAPVGGVAISVETAARLPAAQTTPLGLLELKGRRAPLQAYQPLALDSRGDASRN